MKKVFKILGVLLSALLITSLAYHQFCKADLKFGKADGTLSDEPAHIQIGTHPVQKIELYNPMDSEITFVDRGISPASHNYFTNDIIGGHFTQIRGSRSIANSNLLSVQYYSATYTQNPGLDRKYFMYFLESFIKTKFPVNMNIGANSYPLMFFNAQGSGASRVSLFINSNAITNTADQVRARSQGPPTNTVTRSDYSATLSERNDLRGVFTDYSISLSDVTFVEFISNSYTGSAGPINSWLVGYEGSKTPSHVVINGVELPVAYVTGLGSYRTTSNPVPSNLRASSSMLSWRVNVKFTDGSYAGQSTTTTPGVVIPASLTKSINFELVDNDQVVFTIGLFDSTATFRNVTLRYRGPRSNFSPRNTYVLFANQIAKIPSQLVINGRKFRLIRSTREGAGAYIVPTNVTIPSDFIPSATNRILGINIEFTDNTYLNNKRTKLFGGLVKIWEDLEQPTITAFSASPSTIDLDTRPTGNISFSYAVTGTPATITPTPRSFTFGGRSVPDLNEGGFRKIRILQKTDRFTRP